LELFGKTEDVRRLDFAICVASGDVEKEIINKKTLDINESDNPYSSDNSKNLILWAWSRTQEQVVFTAMAESAILFVASEMADKYSSKCPLVEPSDQRLKIARLSVACAARLFSCDDTHEKIVVDVGHVAFVRNYLMSVYDAPSMSYHEYSLNADKGEKISKNEQAVILDGIKQMPDWFKMCEFLRDTRTFRQIQLMEAMGWERNQTKDVIKKLCTTWQCIKSTQNGYFKNPFFITLLKYIIRTEKGKYYEDQSQLELESNAIDSELEVEPF
jgi:hypothetical protein